MRGPVAGALDFGPTSSPIADRAMATPLSLRTFVGGHGFSTAITGIAYRWSLMFRIIGFVAETVAARGRLS